MPCRRTGAPRSAPIAPPASRGTRACIGSRSRISPRCFNDSEATSRPSISTGSSRSLPRRSAPASRRACSPTWASSIAVSRTRSRRSRPTRQRSNSTSASGTRTARSTFSRASASSRRSISATSPLRWMPSLARSRAQSRAAIGAKRCRRTSTARRRSSGWASWRPRGATSRRRWPPRRSWARRKNNGRRDTGSAASPGRAGAPTSRRRFSARRSQASNPSVRNCSCPRSRPISWPTSATCTTRSSSCSRIMATPRRSSTCWNAAVRARSRTGCRIGRARRVHRPRRAQPSRRSRRGWTTARCCSSTGSPPGPRLLSGIEPLERPQLRHVIVVPDGPLSAVPFEALRAGSGPGSLLVERFDVSYLPSAAILLREPPAARRSWVLPWRRQLLAFGDPLVSARSTGAFSVALRAEEQQRGRLATSAEEVSEIARLAGGRAELHLGAANSKTYLLEGRAKGVPLLHLSTHATADEVNAERSRILFSAQTDGDGADYLFLKEIYDLDLRGVDLTTLSACDTERGRVIRGEGLQGFSRALLSAGSRATVTTLWRVADRPTTELMKQFYFELGRRQPKAEALRLAKLRFLRSGTALQHPRYWAAFVLTGDGLSPVPRAFPWNGLLAPLALLLLAAGVLVGRRKPRMGHSSARAASIAG